MKQHVQMSVEVSYLHANKMRSDLSQWKQWIIWQLVAKDENGGDLRWVSDALAVNTAGLSIAYSVFTSTPLLLINILNYIVFLIVSGLSLRPGPPLNHL